MDFLYTRLHAPIVMHTHIFSVGSGGGGGGGYQIVFLVHKLQRSKCLDDKNTPAVGRHETTKQNHINKEK